MFYLIQIHFASLYFELLTFEFKERIEYKRREGIHKIFLWVRFRWGQRAYGTVCTIAHFLANQTITRSLISQCEATVFSRNQHLSHNKFFTKVYKRKSLRKKSVWRIITRKWEYLWRKTLLKSLDNWFKAFICLSFLMKVILYLSFIVYSLVECY